MLFEHWPTLLPSATATGTIRSQPEDFQVEEIPAYLPSGAGSHLMVEFQKRNLNTDDVVRAMARQLQISPNDIGVAGLKDRRAVTRQWLSIPARVAADLFKFRLEGVEILKTGLHGNKLKTGHLRGNRFRVIVRQVSSTHASEIANRCLDAARLGVPNYFGEQRFGRQKNNVEEGLCLLRGQGRRHDRKALRFLLSAVQSSLFNDVLGIRLQRGLFPKALLGDVMQKADSGGVFVCTDPGLDQPRLDSFQIHPTGPMFGHQMKRPEGDPFAMEEEVLAASGVAEEAWKRFPKLTMGSRRALRLSASDLQCQVEEDQVTLQFGLPPGSYATTLLCELLNWQEANPQPG